MKDKLKQYVLLRQDLLEEKKQLEERLNEISLVLAGTESSALALVKPKRGRPPGAQKVTKAPRAKRVNNEMSLKEAIVKGVTSPMTKQEVLEAVQKLGYKFGTGNPMNSVNVVLYGKAPKFKNEDGKFSRQAEPKNSESKAGKPDK